MNPKLLFLTFLANAFLFGTLCRGQDESFGREAAVKALQKAVSFFRKEVGFEGAYVYQVSADLKFREGEEIASRTTGWTEPPGTPYVGEVYVEAYRLTGEKFLLDAALEIADALGKSQLESGGWAQSFELKDGRDEYRYRKGKSKDKAQNHTTLDDDKTQSCMRFLMHLDEQEKFQNPEVREILDYAFGKLLAVQYPNGAWPQGFTGPLNPEDFPVVKARYPESWSREYKKADYRQYYTFNDGTITDMMLVMLEALRIYGEKKFLESAIRTGDFYLLAQMPDPQPGWAQQYHSDMTPAWARKFEPPAISGGESQGVLDGLLEIYRATRNEKYLEPVPRALAYYKSCLRPDGKLARFYELKTNKPLYFTKDYDLTYSDADMPTHYGFIVDSKLERIEKAFLKLKDTPKEKLKYDREFATFRQSDKLSKSAREAAESLDERGAWVEKGSMKNYEGIDEVITSKTFSRRITELARYVSSVSGK